MAYIQDVQESVPALPEAGNLTSFVVLSQNENGRRLNFKIVGVDIPSGSTATFSGTKPDGVVYSTTGTISGNIVTVNEDTQMTAVAGSWDAKIRVLNGGNVIASAKVRMTIDADPVAPGSIPSDSQLDGIVAECQAYAESARSDAYGSPLTASTAAGMIDKTRVYVYTGSETGYTNGHWYYWDGTAWADGGTYNSSGIQTDTTLSVPGMAADAKATGDEITDLKESLKLKADLPTVTIENASIASFNDGAEDVPIKELKVGIEPIQSGSGDPSPTNVRPISGRDSVTVTRTGKNLFDGILEQGSFNDNGEELSTTTRLRTDYVVVPEGAVALTTPTSNVYVHEVYGYDENKVFTSKLSSGISAPSGTISVPSGTKYIRFSLRYANNGTITPTGIQAQAEAGSTATTYESYTADSYPIPFSSTIYGGTLDVGTGVLTVDRAMVDLGTLNWSYKSSFQSFTNGELTPTFGDGGNIVCSHYPKLMNLTGDSLAAHDKVISINKASVQTTENFASGLLVVKDTDYTDPATFKTAMDGVQLCYELATPTTVQLTPAQVTTLLKDNNIFADSGDVKKLIYRADLGAYIEKLINA